METIYQIGNADNPYTDIEKFSQMCFQYANSYNCKNLNNSAIISYSIHADETSLHCHMRRIFYVEDEKDQGALVPSQDKALKEMGYELKDPSKAKSQKNNRLQPYTAYERTRFMDIAERIDPTLTINREAKSASHEHLEKLEYQNQQEQIRLEQNRAEAKRHNKNAKRLDELNKQMEARLNKNQGIIRQQETQYNELKATCEDLEDERERLERAYRKYEGSLDDKLASVQRAANYETLEKFMGKEQLQEVVDNAKRKLKQISHQRNQQHNNDFYER